MKFVDDDDGDDDALLSTGGGGSLTHMFSVAFATIVIIMHSQKLDSSAYIFYCRKYTSNFKT